MLIKSVVKKLFFVLPALLVISSFNTLKAADSKEYDHPVFVNEMGYSSTKVPLDDGEILIDTPFKYSFTIGAYKEVRVKFQVFVTRNEYTEEIFSDFLTDDDKKNYRQYLYEECIRCVQPGIDDPADCDYVLDPNYTLRSSSSPYISPQSQKMVKAARNTGDPAKPIPADFVVKTPGPLRLRSDVYEGDGKNWLDEDDKWWEDDDDGDGSGWNDDERGYHWPLYAEEYYQEQRAKLALEGKVMNWQQVMAYESDAVTLPNYGATHGDILKTSFTWDTMTNRNGVVREVMDSSASIALVDADTGEFYYIYRDAGADRYSFSFKRGGLATADNTGYVFKETIRRNLDTKVSYMLVKDYWCTEWYFTETARDGGFDGFLKYFNDNCNGGVLAYQKDVGMAKAYESTPITWKIKTPEGLPFNKFNDTRGGREFDVISYEEPVDPYPFYTVGKYVPLFSLNISIRTFPAPGSVQGGTAIDNVKKEKDFVVYSENGQVKFKSKNNEYGSLSIFSTSGSLAAKQQIAADEATINSLNKGVYVIQLKDKKGKVVGTEKVVVK